MPDKFIMDKISQKDRTMVTSLFRDRDNAERAYETLRARGYTDKEINVLMSAETRRRLYEGSGNGNGHATETKALEGAGAGAGIGGTLGAVIGAVAAIGTTLPLPGLGLLVAGPLAAALAGAGAGGLAGGIIGALVGSGIPEHHAKKYEQGIREGGIVMGVKPKSDEDAEYLENALRAHKGEDIYR